MLSVSACLMQCGWWQWMLRLSISTLLCSIFTCLERLYSTFTCLELRAPFLQSSNALAVKVRSAGLERMEGQCELSSALSNACSNHHFYVDISASCFQINAQRTAHTGGVVTSDRSWVGCECGVADQDACSPNFDVLVLLLLITLCPSPLAGSPHRHQDQPADRHSHGLRCAAPPEIHGGHH